MTENEIAQICVDAAWHVHQQFGPGMLESIYEALIAYEIQKRGLKVERQVVIPLVYDGHHFEEALRADLVVEQKVIIELKSVEQLAPVHSKQVLTQLRLSGLKLGLLINLGGAYFKDNVSRIINGQLT